MYMPLLHFRPNLEKKKHKSGIQTESIWDNYFRKPNLGLLRLYYMTTIATPTHPKKKKYLIIFMSENKLYVCTRVELIKKMYKNHIQKSYELKTKQSSILHKIL